MHALVEGTIGRRPGGDRRGLGHATAGARPAGRRLPRRLEPRAARAGRGGRPGLCRGRQPDHPDQHLRRQPLRARRGTALAEQVAEINRAGVEISRRAAGGRARVFASIGPSGVMLMMGEVSRGRTAGRLRRAGPGHGRRGRRRPGDRDHVRSGRGRAGRGGRQGHRACRWWPA